MYTDMLISLRFEWIITLIIFILLVVKLTDGDKNPKSFLLLANSLLFVNLIAGFLPMPEGSLFKDFFHTNHLIVLEKNILNLGLLLISISATNWLKTIKDTVEFYILILASMLGIFTMLSSGHIIMLYLGLEMSTIPLAALSNFKTDSQKGSEAGIKLILSSAFSTGIMLFGISLLYGAVGDLSFSHLISTLEPNPLTIMAFVFILSGFAFKMSVVPFHLWTADVYEGSPIVVTNYLSVISKASVIFVFLTVLYTLFGSLKEAWLLSITILAILSMTIGNLFALRQTNIKRFLAFSSIAQVGFVLVGIAAASKAGSTAAIYFVIIYILSNIAAFAVIAGISDAHDKEDLSDYKGLYKNNKFYALMMGIVLFSLAGVPPTSGFFGKLFLLSAGMSNKMYLLVGFAAINLVLSLYNYLRIVKIMFIDENENPLPYTKPHFTQVIVLVVCVLGILGIAYFPMVFDLISSLGFGI